LHSDDLKKDGIIRLYLKSVTR